MKLISDQIGGSGKIAILSATPNATNQNAWIELMKKELAEAGVQQGGTGRHGVRQRRRPEVVHRDAGPAAVVPGPEGHHLADHGGHRGGRPLPVRFAVQGQGGADRAGHAEPDAPVRQGRHGQAVRAVEPGRPRLPGRVRRRRAGLRPDHRRGRARSSRPASWASTRSATRASWCSARRRCSTPTTSTSSTSERGRLGGRKESPDGTDLLHPAGGAGPAGRVPGPPRGGVAGDAGTRCARPAGATTPSSSAGTAC